MNIFFEDFASHWHVVCNMFPSYQFLIFLYSFNYYLTIMQATGASELHVILHQDNLYLSSLLQGDDRSNILGSKCFSTILYHRFVCAIE